MTEEFYLGSSPLEEHCVQVSKHEDYFPAMMEECRRYKEMLIKRFPDIRHGQFHIKKCPHDFGMYAEVTYRFDDRNEQAWEEAEFVESNVPSTWDDNDVIQIYKDIQED